MRPVLRALSVVVATVSLSTLLIPNAQAAAIPDAGKLLKEQRQTAPDLPDRLPKDADKAVERPTQEDSGEKVLVKQIRFTGHEGVATDAELQPLVADALDKKMSVTELKRLAERVSLYLQNKGYLLARAYLPKQDVTNGIIEIAIVAGKIDGAVQIKTKDPHRVRDSVLRGIVDSAAPPSSAVKEKQLERAILLINDLPGMSSRATLEKGSTPGTTKVLLDASEGPLFTGMLSGDNFGNRYTGEWRGVGQVALNDAFGIGDQFTVLATGAENLFEGRVGYSMPLGSRGLRANVFYDGLYYELGKDLEPLDANGRADTVGANLSYPLIRTRNLSVWSGLSYEYRSLRDEALSSTTRDRRLNVGTVDINANTYDNFGGGGLTTMKFAITAGNADLRAPVDKTFDAITANVDGSYMKLTYALARLQRLTDQFSLYGAASGQIAFNNLDSSEKFILGGPTGVRAYPVGEAAGDSGHLLTAELRYEIPVKASWGNFQFVAFADAGNITLHYNEWANSVNTATGKNNYWIGGGGGGLNIGKAGVYSLRASYAHTIADNPGRAPNGKFADNLSDQNRFWLQAVIWF